jgi:hypothetical protein
MPDECDGGAQAWLLVPVSPALMDGLAAFEADPPTLRTTIPPKINGDLEPVLGHVGRRLGWRPFSFSARSKSAHAPESLAVRKRLLHHAALARAYIGKFRQWAVSPGQLVTLLQQQSSRIVGVGKGAGAQ